jgi:hypothetical protein
MEKAAWSSRMLGDILPDGGRFGIDLKYPNQIDPNKSLYPDRALAPSSAA